MARLVRLGCCLVAVGATAAVAAGIASSGDPGRKLREGGWILALLLASYLFGFVAVTSPRCAAGGRVLLTAAAAGLATIAVAALLVVVAPPVPAGVGPAVLVVALGSVGAAALVQHRHGDRAAVLAGLLTATVSSLGIVMLVDVVATVGAPELIPALVPLSLPPATQLAESRIELVDPYLGLLLLGAVAAATLGVRAIRAAR
ncbi:hypothetical protein SAMN05421684_4938 [Asanoa ishikariensis]|uniref:ABC-2 type transport system permease protein n=1 Tax=Asanoa ishikariensis TaxID=137265 RepID=A0A1H3SYJ6_9ACTN|nr:hypothetical protein SAMN05421684_4938 [Asanoa ishikariensis]